MNRLFSKTEIDVLVCKKLSSIYDLNVKGDLHEKRLDNPDLYRILQSKYQKELTILRFL